MSPNKLNKIFRDIFREVNSKWVNRICPDQYIFTYNFSSVVPSKDDWKRENISDFKQTKRSKIILILESPHYDEFRENQNCPANGKTGNNISDFFHEKIIIKFKIPNGNYDVFLINAIRYQCSIGLKTSIFRNIFFIKIWNNGGKVEFLSRLKKINLSNHDYIINCCTKGSFSDAHNFFDASQLDVNLDVRLDKMVNEVLKDLRKAKSFILKKSSHPSSWRNKSVKE